MIQACSDLSSLPNTKRTFRDLLNNQNKRKRKTASERIIQQGLISCHLILSVARHWVSIARTSELLREP